MNKHILIVALLIANGAALAEEAPAVQSAVESSTNQPTAESTKNVKQWYEHLPAESKVRQAAEKNKEAHRPLLRDLKIAFTCLTRPYLHDMALDDYCNCSRNKYLVQTDEGIIDRINSILGQDHTMEDSLEEFKMFGAAVRKKSDEAEKTQN